LIVASLPEELKPPLRNPKPYEAKSEISSFSVQLADSFGCSSEKVLLRSGMPSVA
jgi:hypothetical protein